VSHTSSTLHTFQPHIAALLQTVGIGPCKLPKRMPHVPLPRPPALPAYTGKPSGSHLSSIGKLQGCGRAGGLLLQLAREVIASPAQRLGVLPHVRQLRLQCSHLLLRSQGAVMSHHPFQQPLLLCTKVPVCHGKQCAEALH
jgi:hypothetical protein